MNFQVYVQQSEQNYVHQPDTQELPTWAYLGFDLFFVILNILPENLKFKAFS